MSGMLDTSAQDFWLDRLGEARRFNDWVFSRFRGHLGENILEVGCGSGNFTVLMAASGHQVTGFDMHDPYVQIARRRLAGFPRTKVVCADATEYQWEDTYDTIVLLDVLEHIEDDVGFLIKLRSAIGAGGRLILKVPAHPFLYCGMDRAIGHFRRYDRASLRATLQKAGFSMVEQSYFNIAASLGWLVTGKIMKRVTPPAEQLAAFERLVPLFRRLEGRGRLPLGASLIAVGAVPAA
jgi:SAM-dependent methyltransferase